MFYKMKILKLFFLFNYHAKSVTSQTKAQVTLSKTGRAREERETTKILLSKCNRIS